MVEDAYALAVGACRSQSSVCVCVCLHTPNMLAVASRENENVVPCMPSVHIDRHAHIRALCSDADGLQQPDPRLVAAVDDDGDCDN